MSIEHSRFVRIVRASVQLEEKPAFKFTRLLLTNNQQLRTNNSSAHTHIPVIRPS